jgi:hypothetical protein
LAVYRRRVKMKKQFWVWVIPVWALIFALVLAGCGSTPQAAAQNLSVAASYDAQEDGGDTGTETGEDATAVSQEKIELQEMYMDYLRQEGYAPSVDSDGDVAFKSDGRTYYIIVDEGDPVYFKIMFPNFWEIESGAERTNASAVIMSVNRGVKVAKVYIGSNDYATIIADIYLDAKEDFSRHFPRMFSAIQTARQNFINGMNG